MNEHPAPRHMRSTLIVGLILLVCVAIIVYVGWAIFQTINIAQISSHHTLSLKMMFLGLVFGLLGVLIQRRGRRRQ